VGKNKCSHDKCQLDVYDGEKCIFHCEKTKDNGWIIDEKASSVESRWNLKKVEEFWRLYLDKTHDFPMKSLIPPFLLEKRILFERDKDIKLSIVNCIILDDFIITDFYNDIKVHLLIFKSIIRGKLSLFNSRNRVKPQTSIVLIETLHEGNIKIFSSTTDSFRMQNSTVNSLDFTNSSFEGKVEISNSVIKKDASFENTVFKQVADFSNTTFYQNDFTNTLFEDTTSFIESKFCDNVDFKYTVFEKLVIFRKAIFEKSINFEDSIIKGEANFLNIILKNKEINIANTETARIIKHSFDKVGNTIEANKYFAYEMKKERESISIKDDLNKKIMLNLNYWISNFGQSWIRPLSIILVVAILHTLLIYGVDSKNFQIINPSNPIYDFLKWIVDFSNNLAYNILPFKKSLIHGQEFISLVFLIIYSTLIYNLIIAVKRITKR